MTDLTELDKVQAWLEKNEIEYTRIDRDAGTSPFGEFHQVMVPDRESYEWDVICHPGSYGWEMGRLEAMGNIVDTELIGDTVEGYLKAEEVIERLKVKYGRV